MILSHAVAHHRCHQRSLYEIEDAQVEVDLLKGTIQPLIRILRMPDAVARCHLREGDDHIGKLVVAVLRAQLRYRQLYVAHIMSQPRNTRLIARHHVCLICGQLMAFVTQLLDACNNALTLLRLLGEGQHIHVSLQYACLDLIVRRTQSLVGPRNLLVERELLASHHVPVFLAQFRLLGGAETLIRMARTGADKETRSRRTAFHILSRLIRRLIMTSDAKQRGAIVVRHPHRESLGNSLATFLKKFHILLC